MLPWMKVQFREVYLINMALAGIVHELFLLQCLLEDWAWDGRGVVFFTAVFIVRDVATRGTLRCITRLMSRLWLFQCSLELLPETISRCSSFYYRK